jgi:hypothetical protein
VAVAAVVAIAAVVAVSGTPRPASVTVTAGRITVVAVRTGLGHGVNIGVECGVNIAVEPIHSGELPDVLSGPGVWAGILAGALPHTVLENGGSVIVRVEPTIVSPILVSRLQGLARKIVSLSRQEGDDTDFL